MILMTSDKITAMHFLIGTKPKDMDQSLDH